MGDVLLPPKRQAAVDRLRRRFELYRRHHNACSPRYEQAADALLERQKQETLLLKQRFLESKAKKAKNNKTDHHRTVVNKDSVTENQKLTPVPKPVKRVAEESPSVSSTDVTNEDSERSAKIARQDNSSDPTSTESKSQQSSTPSFSVQIVQQFTNSNPSQAQTIQTNVTVQAFGGNVQPSDSSAALNPPPQSVTVNQSQQTIGVNSSQSQATCQHQSESQSAVGGSNVECKQEKVSGTDLCQCKSQTSSSGGDRLSDTFPSISFAEDSGDDVIHPDILKDLIDDVFTNSADIMKDFNFEDSVESVKDGSEKNDIDELVKASTPSAQLQSFQRDGLVLTNGRTNPQGGVFENSSAGPVVTVAVMPTSTSAASTTALYAPTQRLSSYGGSALGLASGLGLDFKLTEPSPAALTLKQMAEQHQNMQQKQQQQTQQLSRVMGSATGVRNAFGQDVFADAVPNFRSRFLNGAITGQKLPNTGLYGSMPYDTMNNFPGIIAIQGKNSFKQETCPVVISRGQTQNADMKSPVYSSTTRPLTHYSDAINQNGVAAQQQVECQYPPANDVRLQMTQSQQLHVGGPGPPQPQLQQVQSRSPETKQQPSMLQPHNVVYNNYTPQTGNSQLYEVSMSQSLSYSSQFGNSGENRHPQYKTLPANINSNNLSILDQQDALPQMNFQQFARNQYIRHQRQPHVALDQNRASLDQRTNDWRQVHHHQQQQQQQQQNQMRLNTYHSPDDYSALMADRSLVSVAPTSRNQFLQQYRPEQLNPGRLLRPNLMSSAQVVSQVRQQISVPHRPFTSSLNMDVHSLGNNTVTSLTPPTYHNHQDLVSRQDNNQLNLDFLDSIESSASDLLNFDQVMQGNGAHFQLLDDMEILNK